MNVAVEIEPPLNPIGSDSMKVRPDANTPYAKTFFRGDSAAKGAMRKTRFLVQSDFGLEASFGLSLGVGQDGMSH